MSKLTENNLYNIRDMTHMLGQQMVVREPKVDKWYQGVILKIGATGTEHEPGQVARYCGNGLWWPQDVDMYEFDYLLPLQSRSCECGCTPCVCDNKLRTALAQPKLDGERTVAPVVAATDTFDAHGYGAGQSLQRAQDHLNQMVLATPTGKKRELLTEASIMLMGAAEKLKAARKL